MQIAEGDPGHRRRKLRLNGQPVPQRGYPPCPDHLQGEAAEMWHSLTEALTEMDLDARCDGPLLAGMVTAWARAREADRIIQRDGIMAGDRPHPAAKISRDAWNQVRQLCGEFGLSPLARSRTGESAK